MEINEHQRSKEMRQSHDTIMYNIMFTVYLELVQLDNGIFFLDFSSKLKPGANKKKL